MKNKDFQGQQTEEIPSNSAKESRNKLFEDANKIKSMLTKVDEVKRKQDLEMVESLNFLEDPQYIK